MDKKIKLVFRFVLILMLAPILGQAQFIDLDRGKELLGQGRITIEEYNVAVSMAKAEVPNYLVELQRPTFLEEYHLSKNKIKTKGIITDAWDLIKFAAKKGLKIFQDKQNNAQSEVDYWKNKADKYEIIILGIVEASTLKCE